jgi:hypothetical protein
VEINWKYVNISTSKKNSCSGNYSRKYCKWKSKTPVLIGLSTYISISNCSQTTEIEGIWRAFTYGIRFLGWSSSRNFKKGISEKV